MHYCTINKSYDYVQCTDTVQNQSHRKLVLQTLDNWQGCAKLYCKECVELLLLLDALSMTTDWSDVTRTRDSALMMTAVF